MRHRIAPQSGTALRLHAGQTLTVVDPMGGQVADLFAISSADTGETMSSGRTIDYLSKVYLTKDDVIYSNRSNVMLKIIEDTVGRHDFLLSPCSREMFQILYGEKNPLPGCFGNLASALTPFGVDADSITVAFNCFMHVPINGITGQIEVLPPISRAGDFIQFQAAMDVIIGLTACSAALSNGGSFKPIDYEIT